MINILINFTSVAIVIIFGLSKWLQNDIDRTKIINFLKNDKVSHIYHKNVKSFEVWLNKLYGPSLSMNAFLVSLTIAFVYPYLGFLLSRVAGGSANIAGINLSGNLDALHPALRMLMPFTFVVLFACWYLILRFMPSIIDSIKIWIFKKLSTLFSKNAATIICGITALSVFLALLYFNLIYPVNNPYEVHPDFYITFDVIYIFWGSYHLTFFSINLLNKYPPITLIVVAFSTMVGALFELLYVSIAGSLLGIGFSFCIWVWSQGKTKSGLFSLLGTGALTLALAGSVLPLNYANFKGSIVIVFMFCLLPLLNALFDYVSCGWSRYFLRKAQKGESLRIFIFHILFDLIIGLMLLLLFCVLMPLVAEWTGVFFSYYSGEPITIDWVSFAENGGDAPFGEGVFTTIMVVTTLLPTVVHILAAYLAALVNFNGDRIANMLEKNKGSLISDFQAIISIVVLFLLVPSSLVVSGIYFVNNFFYFSFASSLSAFTLSMSSLDLWVRVLIVVMPTIFLYILTVQFVYKAEKNYL